MQIKDLLRAQQLDKTATPFRAVVGMAPPRRGWVRGIREALGMTSQQLAKRLKVKKSQTIEDVQKSEESGTIKIQTLRRLADALNCDFVYALVPRKPILEMKREQARAMAQKLVGRVSHTMKLEAQGVDKAFEDAQIQYKIEQLLRGDPKKLWD